MCYGVIMTEKVKREATSIKIRPDVWKEAKIEAIHQDMDLSELVEVAIEGYIVKAKEKRKVN